jgi:hypothetical protein
MTKPKHDPKIRWLTDTEKETIAALTGQLSQKEIGEKLGRHRSDIYRAQRALGLQLKRHGPRCPDLTRKQELKILSMLAKHGTSWIGDHSRFSAHQARLVAKKYGFRRQFGQPWYRWQPSREKLREIINMALSHDFSVAAIARITHSPYRPTLRIIHLVLGCEKFISGSSYLDSYLPSKYRSPLTKESATEVAPADPMKGRDDLALYVVDAVHRAAGRFPETEKIIEICTLVVAAIYSRANPAIHIGAAELHKIQNCFEPHVLEAIHTLRIAQSGTVN